MQKTWFITDAGRGLGAEIAKAALRAGDFVVAAGGNRGALRDRLGPDSDRLLSVELDVNNEAQAQAAVDAAVAGFGTIDVLVNNAGHGQLGLLEETAGQGGQAQSGTNLFGVFSVTRAVLPVMRSARQGRIFNVSSSAGLRGAAFGSLHSASSFALEGFSESLAQEIAPFGILVTIVEPGPFRSDVLSAEAVLRLASEPEPPRCFVAGSIAFDSIRLRANASRSHSRDTRFLAPQSGAEPRYSGDNR